MVKNTLGGFKGKSEIENEMTVTNTETAIAPKRKYVRKNKETEPVITNSVIDINAQIQENNKQKPDKKKKTKVEVKVEVVKIEEPNVEELKLEEPKMDEKKDKNKKSKEPKKAKTPKEPKPKKESKTPKNKKETVETPVVETHIEPVVEPIVETPVVDTPVVETPVVETPVVDTPIVEIKEKLLKTKRLKYEEKTTFLVSCLHLLSKENLLDKNQVLQIQNYLKNNTVHAFTENHIDDEMEEVTLTVIKYKYNDILYLKDEEGNLYDINSPHNFVLNIHDHQIESS